jgi:tetratricopeptide (TPR) repeat protein
MSPAHHIFISYASKDNQPPSINGRGWVTAFVDYIAARHQAFAGRPLNVFFDQRSIDSDADWRIRILSALRSSRLLVAFVSPAWVNSKYCRWELEEYLRLEHTLARGAEGIKQVYLVPVPDLETDEPPTPSDFAHLVEDLRSRQRDNGTSLIDIVAEGDGALIDALARMDASDRLAAVKSANDPATPSTLANLAARLDAIDASISKRLDDALFAELASDFGSLDGSYGNFVGRADELRRLHHALTSDKIGVIGALHGLGGQGKTALAIMYAHAYAGFYACGGRWQIPCEGVDRVSTALARLPERLVGPSPNIPDGLSDAEAERFKIDHYKYKLRSAVEARHADMLALRQSLPEGHGSTVPDLTPRLLLIFDNVDKAGLLSETALGALGQESWLEIIATTRLGAEEMGDLGRLRSIEVGDLSPADAMALLRAFRPVESDADEAAARQIVTALAGFTLAIELVGAEMGARKHITWADMAARLQADLSRIDRLSSTEAGTVAGNRIRHRERQIGVILESSIATLPDAMRDFARTVLDYASLFPPETVVLDWLRELAVQDHPALSDDEAWHDVLDVLDRRRLLPRDEIIGPSGQATARMHRLLQAMAQATMGEDRRAERYAAMVGLAEGLMNRAKAQSVADKYAPQPWLSDFSALCLGLIGGGNAERMAPVFLNLGNRLSNLGQREAALTATQEAVKVYRVLAVQNPASLTPDLATSLNNLGLRFSNLGQREAALTATQEALEMRRTLAHQNPAAFEPDSARSLNNVGSRLSAVGQREAALAATQEAVKLNRVLANQNPAAFTPDLAMSLNNLGNRLSDLGQRDTALAATQEALNLFRVLAEQNPAAFTPDLAMSLNNLGNRLSDLGQRDAALVATQEAVKLRRVLADQNSAAFAPDLAMSLGAQGQAFLGLGKRTEAIASFAEGLKIIAPFAQAMPGAFGRLAQNLESALQNARAGGGIAAPPIPAPAPMATSWRDHWPVAGEFAGQLKMGQSKFEALLDRCWRIANADASAFPNIVRRALKMDRAPEDAIAAFVTMLETRP